MTVSHPHINASNTIIVRLKINQKSTTSSRLASVCETISKKGGIVGAVDLLKPEPGILIRDISIFTNSPEHGEEIVLAIKKI